MEIKVRVIIFLHHMTSWVYISTVCCFHGASGRALGPRSEDMNSFILVIHYILSIKSN